MLDVITSDERLSTLLAAHLGPDFYLLERSEIYVARHNSWHTDQLYGPLLAYEKHLDRSRQVDGVFWDAENGELPRGSAILTVAFYFRDHDEDGQGLTVIPYSHANQTEWARVDRLLQANRLRGERVSTRAGDAVVFDSRLFHRGPPEADSDFLREPGAHRSVGFMPPRKFFCFLNQSVVFLLCLLFLNMIPIFCWIF